jgi:hypothetical protein
MLCDSMPAYSHDLPELFLNAFSPQRALQSAACLADTTVEEQACILTSHQVFCYLLP